MATRMNHAKHAHRGRPTEMAYAPRKPYNDKARAVAASPVRRLGPAERAQWAAANGYAAVAR